VTVTDNEGAFHTLYLRENRDGSYRLARRRTDGSTEDLGEATYSQKTQKLSFQWSPHLEPTQKQVEQGDGGGGTGFTSADLKDAVK
jgi:hypothetical protein